jgi:hypothetical protein
MARDYCICPARDGLLYVEFPTYEAMRNLLLNQRFREAHFRTVDGYVPYYGAALAFDTRSLMVFAGVKPLWYPRKGGDRQRAMAQVVADGIYTDEHEAYDFQGHHYGDECEWRGERGLRFDPSWIEHAWIWPGRATPAELAARQDEIAWLLPGVTVEFGKPEFPEGGRRPCR